VPTIADVAREVGYSPMTVSRVINGEKNVREATRLAVQEAVAKLNYSPNLAARSLAGAEQIRIAMMYGNPSATYLSRLMVGTLEKSRESHVQLIIDQCEPGREIPEVFNDLIASGVDGIVMSAPLADTEPVIDAINQSEIPCVVVANWIPPGRMSVVRIDDVGAATMMTQHLISLGHQRIGFIMGNPEQKASSQRLMGYQAALVGANIAIDPDYIVPGMFTYRSGLEAAEKLFNLPNPPTAIFASNDDMAAATVTVAHRRHMEVPCDVTVCGFDDTDFALSIWPELTTIHQPIAQMAGNAVEILVEHIRDRRNGRPLKRIDRLLDFTFVRRESDGPPAS
jgi:LacI family transcriptional regulator